MTTFVTDRTTLERVTEVSFLRRGGPGGQHRNKVETAVRLFHPPSGLTVLAHKRRSQSMNREEAFDRLAQLLRDKNKVPKVRHKTKPTRASKRRRLDSKRRKADLKKGRQTPPED
jgi:protein subunit release factor B